MNQMLIVLAAVALLASQVSGQAPKKSAPAIAGDSAKPLGPLRAVLPESVCSPGCSAVCDAQKAFCIDLPGVDCSFIYGQCDTLCKMACDCYANCRAGCDKQTGCDSGDLLSIGGVLCQFKLKTCVAACQTTCPAQFQFGLLQYSVQFSMEQLQNFIGMASPK